MATSRRVRIVDVCSGLIKVKRLRAEESTNGVDIRLSVGSGAEADDTSGEPDGAAAGAVDMDFERDALCLAKASQTISSHRAGRSRDFRLIQRKRDDGDN